MFSNLQRTFSAAIAPFTSTKEPKLLKRPSSDISSQPDDPATPPITKARMPHPRPSIPANTDTRKKGEGKAKAFMQQNFSAAEIDDPIEISSPPDPHVRRIKSASQPTTVKSQLTDSSLNRSKISASKPVHFHRHLLRNPEERSLFPGNAPPDPNAFLILPPGQTQSNDNLSSATMRHQQTLLRPMNTLDRATPNQTPNVSKIRSQDASSRQSGMSGPKDQRSGSSTGFSTRKTGSEPPFKRQRVERLSKPYVKDEGAGAVSPMFSSTEEDIIVTKSQTVIAPSSKQSRLSKPSIAPAVAVDEYRIVEETMQSNFPKKRSKVLSPHFIPDKFLKRPRQPSDDSDSGKFTQEAKKARYEELANDPPNSVSEIYEDTPRSRKKADRANTPVVISDIFNPSILPSKETRKTNQEAELSNTTLIATSEPGLIHKREQIDALQGTGSATHESQPHPPPAVTKPIPSKKPKPRSKTAISRSRTFELLYLKHGILPDEESYTVEVSENSLRFYKNDPLLSKEPICPDLALSKVFKIKHGTSDDCLKLILETSHDHGTPYDKPYLEFGSRQDMEEFLSLMPSLAQRSLMMEKSDDHMIGCFERNKDQYRGPQEERLVEDDHQPISKQRQVSETESRHFQNQHPPPASNIPRPTKLMSQLQTASQTSKIAGADSRIPTVITGRERANQFSFTPAEGISASSPDLDQVRPSSTSRARSPSRRIAATRSTSRAEAITHEAEEVARMKYSAIHGLGEAWKSPLIYPKAGKRRMTVEYDDLYRLDEDEFLNDNLIGFFLRYLENHLEQTNPELARRVYFYNSYFFERLMQNSKGKKGIDYESVQKWTRNIDIFDRDFVILPVNESYHWYVVIICNLSKVSTLVNNDGERLTTEELPAMTLGLPSSQREDETPEGAVAAESQDVPTEKTTKSLSHLSLSDVDQQIDELAPASKTFSISSPARVPTPRKSGSGRRKVRHSLPKHNPAASIIMTLDSLGVARSSTCIALRQYIVEEAKNKKGWDLNGSLIKGMTATGIPTQSNFSDCGLYLCAYLEKFILDPASFVRKILQREMDPNSDMPMMASEELRSRMRGMIRGLHNEQENEEVKFPIPEVGRILLAPSPIAISADDSHVSNTPSQVDSEDELQRDQPKLRVLSGVKKSLREPTPPSPPTSKPTDNHTPNTRSRLREHADWKISTATKDVLAKINKSASSSVKSKPGTRETAITIDDEEDAAPGKTPVAKDAFLEGGNPDKNFAVYNDVAPPLGVNFVAEKKPLPAHDPFRRDSGSITVHVDDFFEHPSQLKEPASARNTYPLRRKARVAPREVLKGSPREVIEVTPRKNLRDSPKEALKEAPTSMKLSQRRRSQSITSTDTVNTDYLSGRGNKSYQHDDEDGQDVGRVTTSHTAEGVGQSPGMAVLVPDSQENTEVEAEGEAEAETEKDAKVGRAELRPGGHQERTRHEPQVILEGIE